MGKRASHRKKKVPSYWWDIEGDEIIVESDCDKFPVVARFPFDPNDGEEASAEAKSLGFAGKVGCAAGAIEKAEAYIVELIAGRITPKASQPKNSADSNTAGSCSKCGAPFSSLAFCKCSAGEPLI